MRKPAPHHLTHEQIDTIVSVLLGFVALALIIAAINAAGALA